MKRDNRRAWGGILSPRLRRKKYRYRWQLNNKQINYVNSILKGLGK